MSKLTPAELSTFLEDAARAHFSGGVSIEELKPLSGGASQEMWSFMGIVDGEAKPYILRRDSAASALGISRATEYELLLLAEQGGVKVPRPLFFMGKEAGGPGYVMDRLEGQTIPRKILRDEEYKGALPKLTAQCGEELAKIHALDVSSLEGLTRVPEGKSPAGYAVEMQRRVYESLEEPHPTFELALRWLEQNEPADTRRALVHGDFRNGNLMIDENGLVAVLDWELAHMGDPMEDLGWLCVKSWRFGATDKPAGGFGSYGELFESYEKHSGVKVDPEVVRFWEIYGNLKWGVICMLQAGFHLRKLRRSVELAALGRRVCEMEWDLLEMLEKA